MERTAGNFAKVGIGSFLLSAVPSALVASIYSTFRTGFSERKLETFDIFAFWNETPFVVGYHTDEFNIVLAIFGALAVICTIGGLVLSFPKALNSHGSAKWADHPRMKRLGYLKKHKDILGAVFAKTTDPRKTGLYFTNAEQPHCLVSAPTRAGKGVSVVIPTLLTFDGSIIALDVKGELFDLTSRARRNKGDRVYKFSPLAEDGRTHCYNPLDEILASPAERRFTEARRLAANLIVAKNKGAESFIDGSRDLFAAGIMAVIERETPSIGAIYDLFSQPVEKTELFSKLAEETNSREAKSIFNNMAANDLKIITSYTSILDDGGLKLWADALIRAATSKSDFDITTLRKDPASIFLVVNPNDLGTLAPLMRLMFQQIVSTLQANLPTKDEVFEVLFLLDEFKSLGQLATIETAITTIAGFGGRFLFVVQSLANISDLYGKGGKENILGNSGVQAFMATTDTETPEYLSRAIGDFTRKSRSKSWSTRELTGSSIQEREEGSRLIRPEEIRLLPDDEIPILVKGQSPLKLKKVRYYEDGILKKAFEKQRGELPLPNKIEIIPRSAPSLKDTAEKWLEEENATLETEQNAQNNFLDSVSDALSNPVKEEIKHNKKTVAMNSGLKASLADIRKRVAAIE